MKEGIKVLKLNEEEINVILNALKFYKDLADVSNKDSIFICKTILKIVDTPDKISILRKSVRDDAR